MTQEYWLPVVGYEGLYEVSDQGRVRSLPRPGSTRTWRIYGGKVLTPASCRGYLSVKLPKGSRSVHSLVAEAFIGSRPDGMVVRHGENGSSDNSVGNLSYGTQKQNIYDKKRDGTWQIADSAARRILTSEEVITIYQSVKTSPELAEEFGVDQTTVRAIWRGKNWRSVTINLPPRQVRGRPPASSQHA